VQAGLQGCHPGAVQNQPQGSVDPGLRRDDKIIFRVT
jgi:hypothetical protein